ncbi:hypothetical protein LCGC14_2376450 [marine sediment metagenome]|uniref:Transglycosylase SLT domain-containing protein n=1 Tax=marine sediment metagenome TaxID=412755 RepID=A0A0F9C2E2_9ZZZZ
MIGGADGNETTEVQVTSASSLGVGALYQQRSWCGFDLGVLVRCNQADATPQRVAKVADALPTSSPVPLQGRTPIAAAEGSGERDGSAGLETGETILAPVAALSYRPLICSYSWPCETALRIVGCESNGDPAATNGVSWGLFQINAIHAWRWPDFWEHWSDPMRNTQYAWELYQEQGFAPWDCWWAW